ncbi:hypothetical protein XarCFBP6762_00605 [Xanthomonas arboricola]|nr:hypothetical protein XarCFBP6762_00605 [Xanthomonas arboricola]
MTLLRSKGPRFDNVQVALLKPCTPPLSTGPCPPTVVGPYAAWMPRKSLHGRTCGVSRGGRRARASQQSRRSTAPPLIYRTLQALIHNASSNRDLEPPTKLPR